MVLFKSSKTSNLRIAEVCVMKHETEACMRHSLFFCSTCKSVPSRPGWEQCVLIDPGPKLLLFRNQCRRKNSHILRATFSLLCCIWYPWVCWGEGKYSKLVLLMQFSYMYRTILANTNLTKSILTFNMQQLTVGVTALYFMRIFCLELPDFV